jgi:hypothetical protein
VYGLAYCGGVVGAECVCPGLFDENSIIARTFLIGRERERGLGGLIEYFPLFLDAREPSILRETK